MKEWYLNHSEPNDSFMIPFGALVTFSLSPCLAQSNPPNQQTHPKATDSLRFRAPNGQPSRPLSLPFLSRTLGEPSGSKRSSSPYAACTL